MQNNISLIGGGNISVTPSENINDLLDNAPKNQTIVTNLIKAYNFINNEKYQKILCSVSGGSDSDIILDICFRCDKRKIIDYVWFDTGLEYQATKNHLEYLKNKYGIIIRREKAIKSVPASCKQYGQPFLSKQVSEFIQRLQRHDFKWEDESYELLSKKYSKCDAALKWWCNMYPNMNNGRSSKFNISYNKLLKEFIIKNPPDFKISNKCCNYAKKNVAHKLIKEENYDLDIVGVRKAEGGARSSIYKNCFDDNCGECDNYRPIFFYTDEDKTEYEKHYEIEHSDCYNKYGLDRTGCCGCPFGKYYKNEISVCEKFEPKFYKAICNIFKESYEYRIKYEEFKEKNKE